MSFIKWANTAREFNINWTIETMTNESLISRARNSLTSKFLIHPDTTHLMFIDADIGWEPHHLLMLLDADKDVIGGLYPMKSLPVKWCINSFDGAAQEGFVHEVSKTGTGFLLIRRSVFAAMNAHPAVKPFRNDLGLPAELDPYMKTYFDTAVRDGRYYSEDWTFCENWRDLGGRVWVDTRVMLRHTGTYVFDFQTQDKLYQDLKVLAEPVVMPSEPAALEPVTAQIAGRRPVPETPDFAEDETVISPVFGAPVFGALALQSRPAAAVDPDELSDAQVIEFHARAIGRLAAAQECRARSVELRLHIPKELSDLAEDLRLSKHAVIQISEVAS
jgi:hypothetical protein